MGEGKIHEGAVATVLLSLQACPGARGASTCRVGPEGGGRTKERRLQEGSSFWGWYDLSVIGIELRLPQEVCE